MSCGSSGSSTSGASTQPAEGEPQIGGTLNLLGAGDVDHMDPNVSYYSIGYLAAPGMEPAAVHLSRRS